VDSSVEDPASTRAFFDGWSRWSSSSALLEDLSVGLGGDPDLTRAEAEFADVSLMEA